MPDAACHCAHDRLVPIAEIQPNPRNPNLHPPRQIELLAKIILARGWRAPVTISTRSGLIVRGHGRYEAARRAGLEHIPVDFQDYATDAEEMEDLLADNQIAELSQVDDALLRDIFKDYDLNVELTGFDARFVDELLAAQETEALKREILTEEEYKDARNTADRIIEALTQKVRHVEATDPAGLNRAVAVVLQKGRGNDCLILADPNTADAVAELKRLADAGEPSPIEAFFANYNQEKGAPVDHGK